MFKRFKAFEGPAAFTFKDPDTGRLFKEVSKERLMDRITVYRLQNNLEPIDFLDWVVESYWCDQPENVSKCVPFEMKPRGFLGYLKGGVALFKKLMYNKFASQEVADLRSEQCSQCPFNVFPDKGMFIQWSDEIAEATVGERRSKHHDKLGNCGVCSCPLRAKVWIAGEIPLEPEWLPDMKSVNCWQLLHRKK